MQNFSLSATATSLDLKVFFQKHVFSELRPWVRLWIFIAAALAAGCATATAENLTVAVFSHTSGLNSDARALTRGLNTISAYKLETVPGLQLASESDMAAATDVNMEKLWAKNAEQARRVAKFLHTQALVIGHHKYIKGGKVRFEFRTAVISAKSVKFKTVKKTLTRNNVRTLQKSMAAALADALASDTGRKAVEDQDYTGSTRALKLFGEGVDFMARGKSADGFKALKSAAAADKTFRDLDYFLGRYYATEQFDYEKAIYYLDRIVAAHPDDAGAHFWLGFTYYLKGATSSAISEFEKAVKLKPFISDAYVYLAMLYRDRGDFDNTEKFYKKALKYTPDNAALWYNLAGIQAQMNKVDQAVDSLEKVFRLDCGAFLPIARTDSDFARIRKKKDFVNLLKKYENKCND